jgi:hypothetical protein
VIRGDDVRRGRNVLQARHRDAEKDLDQPPEDAADEAIEERRVERVGMDERVEWAADELPELRACIALWALALGFASRGICRGRG